MSLRCFAGRSCSRLVASSCLLRPPLPAAHTCICTQAALRRDTFASRCTPHQRHLQLRGARCAAVAADMEDQQTSASAPVQQQPAWASLPIILGSQSASRRGVMDELAQQFGFEYTTISADIDEKAAERPENAGDLVMALAYAKAQAIMARWEAEPDTAPREGLLITADQVVLCRDEILEKPESEAEARRYIEGYSDEIAMTVGAVRVTNLATGIAAAATDVCEVVFGSIPEEAVEQLLAEGSCYSCAGGLMVEHPLVSPHIETMLGDLDSIMGLPKTMLTELLRKATLMRPRPQGPPPRPENLPNE